MTVDDFIAKFAKIPGFSRRNARKFILHLIKNKHDVEPIRQALEQLNIAAKTCNICGNITFAEDACQICLDSKRDTSTICIVAEIDDIINLERGAWYNGVYHVLWGVLSAMDNISPEALNIKSLECRLEKTKEIIFAGVSSFEWQSTIFYITDIIKSYNPDIKITELARGVPIGSSLEFMDEGTLSEAFQARRTVK